MLKLHQLLGSILSLAFVVWFISGFVMLFSGFPHASLDKQFNKLTALTEKDSINRTFSNLDTNKINKLSLEKINDKPVFRVTNNNNEELQIDAQTLSEIKSFTATELDKLVDKNYKTGVSKKIILTDFDSWIPWSYYEKYFPIHKYYFADPEHSVIYLSEKIGTVVQETNRKQRWLARFGAIPHWFYFKSLRLKRGLWIDLISWLSGIGSIMCITGIVLGFYRYRKRKQQKEKGFFSFSPYKNKWYRWHHIMGFFFGFFTFTFVFSGMMSLQEVPKYIVPVKNSTNYRKIWTDNIYSIKDFKLSIETLFTDERLKPIKRIDWDFSTFDSPSYFVYSKDLYHPHIINASQTDSIIIKTYHKKEIENAVKQKFDINDFSSEEINSPDGYYMGRDNEISFPVIKFKLFDGDKTWLYVNPENLEIVSVLNKNTRTRRWLYKGLHSFNFNFLVKHNWLRIAILIILSVFGTIISISGVVLSYRCVKRKFKKT